VYALLVETVRSAAQLEALPGELPPSVPPELHAISLLPPTSRYCFVLCVLLGFHRDTCAEILGLSRNEVEVGLHHSFIDLPRAVEAVLLPRQEQLEFSI
jgi:DNA-directed RNA polymerase specialized sigma24 family protein